jgi:hypothetical protein
MILKTAQRLLPWQPFGALALCCLFAGCDRDGKAPSSDQAKPAAAPSAEQKERAAKLKAATDPDQKEEKTLRSKWRNELTKGQFDELEKDVADLRATKALYGDGRWKIVTFYEGLVPNRESNEETWQKVAKYLADWRAAKPESLAARVANAQFLVDYAWKARGSGYADTVTEDGARLMQKRLAESRQILMDAQKLKDMDPMYFKTAMTVALGEGWPPAAYDDLVNHAVQFEPKFWLIDASRAYSLLPRWYGEKGDWEAYADKAAARPDGLGAETYARIVIYLFRFHDNIFRDSKASWPKTREGLKIMLKKYPQSVEILHRSALLAAFGGDRTMAKELFDKIGDTYLASVFQSPAEYEHYRHWAETGNW